MFRIILTFFVLGITLGSGPCLASCGPVLITYIVGTGRRISGSLNAYALFSLSRILAYVAQGVIIFFLGRAVTEIFSAHFKNLLFAGGGFILLIGVLMIAGRRLDSGPCAFLHKHFLKVNTKSMLMLGLLVGFLPCAPLFSVFTYSTLVSKSWQQALLYCFTFGVGTIISPLILLVVISGLIPKVLKGSTERINRIMSSVCGVILIFLGTQLIIKAIYA